LATTPKSFDEALNQGLRLLKGLTPKQRIMLFGGAALVGILLWVFVDFLGKPKYVTLYSGLKTADAQAMGSRLAAKNISYELSPDGASLLVASDQLDAARLETASQGLPRTARLGFELFDTPNWTGSDFTEKVNYQRALEGELERTLQTLSDVEAVRVHLVLPRESLFTEEERTAKAAVILKTHGGMLSEQAQQAIPALVASAVDGLQPENVTVVDADSNLPLRHSSGSSGPMAASELEQNLEKTLLRTLDPVIGADHVRASVHVDYDISTSENTDEVYDPTKIATLTQQKSEETLGGGSPSGVPGTASNLPGTGAIAPKAIASNDSQSSRSESETFAVSKSVRHTMRPPGDVKRISAAVLVDDAVDPSAQGDGKSALKRKRTADELKQIEVLAAAAIGIDAQRGDVLSVQNLSFQEAPVEKVASPSRIEKTRTLLMQFPGLLRYLGIFALFLVVYFLILRPVKKQIVTAFRELPAHIARSAGAKSVPSAAVEIELPAGTEQAQRATLLKKQLSDKIKTEPEAATRLVQGWIRETAKS
jgi:flagellar M-ring protein FliF